MSTEAQKNGSLIRKRTEEDEIGSICCVTVTDKNTPPLNVLNIISSTSVTHNDIECETFPRFAISSTFLLLLVH